MIQDPLLILRMATEADLPRLTQLHCATFTPETHVPMILGQRYVRENYRWMVTSSESYVLVACAGQKIVGQVAGSDGPYTRPMFIACLGEFVRSIAKKPLRLLNKNLWGRLFRSPEVPSEQGRIILNYPKVGQLAFGSVDSTYRGQSVFPKLLNGAREISQKRGCRALRTGVYKVNASCRRVLAKGHWTEVPALETDDTIIYMSFLDPDIARELGMLDPDMPEKAVPSIAIPGTSPSLDNNPEKASPSTAISGTLPSVGDRS